MTPPNLLSAGLSRRRFVGGAALTAVALAGGCAHEDDDAFGAGVLAGGPAEEFTPPTARLSGSLRILAWSHFIPTYDRWFDSFASRWGRQVGVDVTVDHIDLGQITTRVAAEIYAGQGHDLIQYVAPLPQFEPAVLDLTDLVREADRRWGQQLQLCRRSGFNPVTNRHFAYAPGWVPDPGNYRRSMWSAIGLPDGPSTWDELLNGGTEIRRTTGVQLGLGMSQELDSNMVGRSLLWSFGASVQDAEGRVTLDSPEAVAAVEYMTRLYRQAMTDEVFSWTPSSNNQGLVAGRLSYISNSISAWRTAQRSTPRIADDIHFVPALAGPVGALAAHHLVHNWIIPKYASGAAAGQEFLLHYTANFAAATYSSMLYDLCAWPGRTPDLATWLGRDPFRADPPDKLAMLTDAAKWSADLGHPGTANAAIGEVTSSFVIPNMFARAARGEVSAASAVAEAAAQARSVYAKWRTRGLVA
ncbi:ABC transporter substrate-binding protein [Dactylosporangium sp. NPDC048998]|uniref:ABC transporter substrate-binding protein n=1 Tax=Dactylosporangium sp. NPDC048998 TaxID=3363976 RepID=UPI0037148E3A